MRVLLTAFAILIGGSSLGAAAADGSALYREHCASCHGQSGAGALGLPLAVADLLAVADDEYFRRTIRLGRPGRHMPTFLQLRDDEVGAIVAYLRSWAPQPRPAAVNVGRGDAMRGEMLYAQWCSLCHGENGEGASTTGVTWSWDQRREVAAPALNNPGFLRAASDAMIKRTLIRGRRGSAMPSFAMPELDEQDLDDIVAFVRSFQTQPNQGGSIYREARQRSTTTLRATSPLKQRGRIAATGDGGTLLSGQ